MFVYSGVRSYSESKYSPARLLIFDFCLLLIVFIAVTFQHTSTPDISGKISFLNLLLHANVFASSTIISLGCAGIYTSRARHDRVWQFIYRLGVGLICALALLLLLRIAFIGIHFEFKHYAIAAAVSFFVIASLQPLSGAKSTGRYRVFRND